MKFNLKHRKDRLGTQWLCILYQFYYCTYMNYYIQYNDDYIPFNDSIFIQCIFKLIKAHNSSFTKIESIIIDDIINIDGYADVDIGNDMCYGLGFIVNLLQQDLLSYFKEKFYYQIQLYYNNLCSKFKSIPFDPENSIIIHLRLDDQIYEEDYDGKICSTHYINLINNSEKCYFTNGPNKKYNKQNPLSYNKIKIQLNILQSQFPKAKIIIIASPLTEIPALNFNYDLIIQNLDYNYDLFLLSKAKKIILSRSNFAVVSLFFGEHTHVHMPLWGHFACLGFGTKYDKNKFTYFY